MYILFNGPPRSGKDTAAQMAYNYVLRTTRPIRYPTWEKFSRPNKECFAALAGAKIDAFFNVDYYEHHKSEIIPWLGVSYRQWQIDFSEKFMKPLYGQDIFAWLLRMRSQQNDLTIISDCGFQIEVDCLIGQRMMLICMKREGCTFEGDSREYVKPAPNWEYHVIANDSSLEHLRKVVETLVGDFIRGTAP